MQYLDIKNNEERKAIQLTKYLLLLLLSLFIWFLPATHNICILIDEKIFRLLNNSLKYSHTWALFWAFLNHDTETWLNLFVMFGLNIYIIVSQPDFRRARTLAGFIYFWVFFEAVWLLTHFIGSDLLEIKRISPSIALPSVVNLSDLLNMQNLKITSSDCLPAGHALILIFWAKFSMLYSKQWLHKYIIAIAIILTLPRLFSGAHWTSDIILTTFYILFWFEVAIGIPLYIKTTKFLERMINI